MRPADASARPAAPNPLAVETSARVDLPHRDTKARWFDVDIYYVDGETLAVRLPGQPLQYVTHIHLAMSNQRNHKPLLEWVLLVQLCLDRGQSSWHATTGSYDAARKTAAKARARLRDRFLIDDNPIICLKDGGLFARFKAHPDRPR